AGSPRNGSNPVDRTKGPGLPGRRWCPLFMEGGCTLSWQSLVLSALFLFLSQIESALAQEKPAERIAPLFDNLGSYHHPITTQSKEAQRYFDQGLTLAYAFNHQEAIRSFQEAARLDPECAMAFWGIAFCYGANINAPMMDDAVPKAYEALQNALKLAPKASANEQGYIQALTKRYTDKPEKDRAPLDR